MLHYRKHLYHHLHEDVLFMGCQETLDFKKENTDEDAIVFHRDLDTRLSVGVDLGVGVRFYLPPPIMKTVETLAHPEYPMGVVVETLHHRLSDNVWVPYYAKILLEGRGPLPILLRPSIALVVRDYLSMSPDVLESTVSRGLWTCCQMTGNTSACEGLSYYEQRVPSASHILKMWPSQKQMVSRVNDAVELLAKNSSNLSQTIVEQAVSDLFVNVSDIPILYRSRNCICNRYIATDRIHRHSFYDSSESPVRIDHTALTDKYSPRFRPLFWAIDVFPLTDFDVTVKLHRDGSFGQVHVAWVIDRNITVSEHTSPITLLEGHVRYICDVLAECLSAHSATNPWVFSLTDLYGTNALYIQLVKSQDELIQVIIRDPDYQVVFGMIIPSALVKLTDFSVMISESMTW